MDESVEWMRLLCMIVVYDCIYIYVCVCIGIGMIFQFKTGVKLKSRCVEPLVHGNLRQLVKNHRK
jgi:hypothetical protein